MSLRRLRNNETDVDEENPYWLSFSDIMSGLLIIFVLASLVLVLELSQRKAMVDEKILERTKAEKVRQEMLREIKEELLRKGIMVEVSDNETVLRIPDDQLAFETNEYRVPPDEKYQKAVIEIGHDICRRTYGHAPFTSSYGKLGALNIQSHINLELLE